MFESKRLGRLLLAPFSLWAAIFVVLPLFFVLYHGLTDEAGAFTLANLGEVFSWEYMAALGLSVELALVSTVLCLILAYPLCMILTSMKKGKMVLIFVLFLLPLWMNSLLTTMAWQTILEKNGLINLALSALGLPTLSLINTPGAIVIGMIYNFLPYMVLPLYVSLSKIDKSVIEARGLVADAAAHPRAADAAGHRERFDDGLHPGAHDVRHQCAPRWQQGAARRQHHRTGVHGSL